MDNDRYRDRLPLYLHDELPTGERRDVEAHLSACAECRAVIQELTRLFEFVGSHAPGEPGDDALENARRDLRRALDRREARKRWWAPVADVLDRVFIPKVRLALGSAALLAGGFAAGHFLQAPGASVVEPAPRTQTETPKILHESTRITNVKFLHAGMTPGEVEFTFDAVMPVHMKGGAEDPEVQKVLAYALMNEQNPGVRLQSVNAIGALVRNDIDAEVRAALMVALRSDDNPGVRMEAARALARLPFDEQSKRAFLDVLLRDSNSGVRIAAINALESARGDAVAPDEETASVFRQRLESDRNPYIRIRAKAAVEEMKKQ